MEERVAIRQHAAFALGLLAVLLLALALAEPWLNVPLLHGWSAFDIPISLGWLGASPFTYGLVGVLAIAVWSIYMLAGGPWPGTHWRSGNAPRPLTASALLRMGLVTLAVPLFFALQFIVADFTLVTSVQDQENQAVLVRRHVSHTLPRQHLAVRSFHIDTADPGDRWRLLIMTGGPGLLIPLGAAACLLYAAFLLRGQPAHHPQENRSVRGRLPTPLRRAGLAVGIAIAVVALARAPVGLAYLYAAQAALQGGDDHGAIALAGTARDLNPAIEQLPILHLVRGEALYRLGQDRGRDVNLFLAAHNRAIGLYSLAWQEDGGLVNQSPSDPVVRRDMEVTLETLAESHSPVKLTPADQDTARKNSLTPLQIKVIEQAIPWLDRLVFLQPDNVYAHYLRGRILFTAHDYQQAQQDFAEALTFTTDGNMRSEAYTYLAFCRGGLQDYAAQRTLLQTAVRLDTGYYNIVAHQALSGLH